MIRETGKKSYRSVSAIVFSWHVTTVRRRTSQCKISQRRYCYHYEQASLLTVPGQILQHFITFYLKYKEQFQLQTIFGGEVALD